MYEITIRRSFAAAHALRLPDGSLEPLHGHNWDTALTVGARELDALETVMDFHELEVMLEAVIGPWRNGHLNELPPFSEGEINPSAERVAWWIGRTIQRQLPRRVTLLHASVTEAPGCLALWRPEPGEA